MKTNNSKKKIIDYFFINPTTKLRVRQIERLTKTALPSVVRYTKELSNENLLKVENVADVLLYSGDRSSKQFILEKKLFNIKQLFDSGLINFLIEEYHNPPIIVFGSYSKGEDIENSDIDIYIESPKNANLDLTVFEKKIKRSIQIFRHRSLYDIKNNELANNIINGVNLNGFVEVFK
jgi:predicted nucleotidyltransferase